MTTGNTTLLGLALPVDGELDGSWGDVVNDSITSLVDSAVAGTTTLPTDADVTLTDTVLASNQARQAILLWTANNGATTRNITAPARSKPYIVINAGTGSIVLRGAGPTTGITIVSGERCLAAWNGLDFVKIATSAVVVPVSTGISGLGTGVATALAVNTNATGGFPTTNGAATLTNKRIDPRVSSTASASSVTPDISAFDQYAFTALAAGLTINAPTGTPVDGDKLVFRFLDNGTARALTWDGTYTAIGVALPTATVVNKTTYVGCIYNANNTRWDVIAAATQG